LVGNNPIKFIDPTGEYAEEEGPKGGHDKGKRPSTQGKHEKGDERRKRDQGGEKKEKRPGWKRYKREIYDLGGWVWGGAAAAAQWSYDGIKSGGQYVYNHPGETVATVVVVGVGVVVWLDPVPGDELIYTAIVGGSAIAR
jgi:hypothetical protein